MSQFLKLRSGVINVRYITKIILQDAKYTVYIKTGDFGGFSIMSTGFFSSEANRIEVCSTNHASEYEQIRKWIESL
jgi:hypothetical protein